MKRNLLTLLSILTVSFVVFAKSEVKRPDSYNYQRGVETYNEEKYTEALEWFERELSQNPDNGYAYMYISFIRGLNDEAGKALNAINEAIKHISKKDKKYLSNVYGYRANIYAELKDTISALNDLAQASKIDPSNTYVYETTGQIHYEQGNYTLADACYKKMISLEPGDITGYLGLARNALEQEEWNDAITTLDHAILLESNNSTAYTFRAEAYMGLEKWTEAADDILMALELNNSNNAQKMMLAFPAEATNVLRTKLKVKSLKNPNDSEWLYYLGLFEQNNEDYDAAISYFQKGYDLDGYSVFLEFISRCYFLKDNSEKALEYVDRAMAISPEDFDLVELKANILSDLGRFDEALTERDRYIAKYPEDITAYIQRGSDRLMARRFEDVIDDLTTATSLAPELADRSAIVARFADAYRLSGQHEEALKYYQKILDMEADSVAYASEFVPFAYIAFGNNEKAIESMQRILDNDTTGNRSTLYNAACLYARIGDSDKALHYLQEILDSGKKFPTHIAVDYDLDSLKDLTEFKELIQRNNSNSVTEISIVADETETDSTLAPKGETSEVPFIKENGVTKVKCTINGLPLHFVFDTGASDVTISMVEANFMLKNDYIHPSDIIGSARYIDANGDVSEGTIIDLRNVNFGGLKLNNVRASVVRNQVAPLLLGQSVLGRLGKIEIDNPNRKIIITQ